MIQCLSSQHVDAGGCNDIVCSSMEGRCTVCMRIFVSCKLYTVKAICNNSDMVTRSGSTLTNAQCCMELFSLPWSLSLLMMYNLQKVLWATAGTAYSEVR